MHSVAFASALLSSAATPVVSSHLLRNSVGADAKLCTWILFFSRPYYSIFHFLTINFMIPWWREKCGIVKKYKEAGWLRFARAYTKKNSKENCRFFCGKCYVSIYELHFLFRSATIGTRLLFYLIIPLKMCKYCFVPFLFNGLEYQSQWNW